METNLPIVIIIFLGVCCDSAACMIFTWRDWILVDKTFVAYLHFLHDFSPQADIKFHKPRAASWAHPVVLRKESLGTSQSL